MDISISKDNQAQFNRYCKDRGILLGVSSSVASGNDIDFTVQVLSIGYWPTYKIYDLNLPTSMDHCCKVRFYDASFTVSRSFMISTTQKLPRKSFNGFFLKEKPQLKQFIPVNLTKFDLQQFKLLYFLLSHHLPLPEQPRFHSHMKH